MKTNGLGILILIVLVLGGILVRSSTYIVTEWEQVILTRFGNPVGEPVTEAGLHFKLPMVHEVNRFDKRILIWDGQRNEITTSDKRFIWVDTTARWRIKDPLLFLQAVRTENGAQSKLDGVLDSATRDVISAYDLIEAVRLTNRVLEIPAEASEVEDLRVRDSITAGRDRLIGEILASARELTPQYGIELIDVRIKRINYVENVRRSVYMRMQSERERIAERYRSEGRGKKKEIEGQTTRDEKRISSSAYKDAQSIIAAADAEAAKIFADAYNADPEFYSFWRTLDAYGKIVGANTTLVLSPTSELYRFMADPGLPPE
jgi:modulator of FtsH protease HflC